MKWLANLEQKMQANFAATPSSGVVFPFLDGFRAYGTIIVVLAHCWALSGGADIYLGPFDTRVIFATFYTVINVSFLLSAMLLSLSWQKAHLQGRPRPKLWPYYKQRFIRIIPAYYCVLFVMLLLMTPQYIPPQTVVSGEGVLRIAAHLTFMQYAFPVSAGTWLVNGSVWSLTMEVIFYLILPWLILLFLGRRWWFWLPVSLVISVAWEWLSFNSLDFLVDFWRGAGAEHSVRGVISYQFPGHLFCFCLGIVLSNFFAQYILKTRTDRLFTVLTGRWAARVYFVAGWVLLLYNSPRLAEDSIALDNRLFCQIAVPIAYALITVGMLFGGVHIRWFFNLIPMRFLGLICYSFFLWHMPVIYILLKYPAIASLQPVLRFWVVTSLDLVITTVLSVGSFLMLEKPFMKIKKKAPTRSTVEVPASTPVLLSASPNVE